MRPRRLLSAVLGTVLVASLTTPAEASAGTVPFAGTQTSTTTTLQPGVTLTRIVAGTPDPRNTWTVEIAVPAGGDPDPDAPAAALSSQADAQRVAADLTAAGLRPRVERVTTPTTADYAPGTLGWRVRVGRYGSAADAAGDLTTVQHAGFKGSAVFTGWDGAASTGPWRIDVLTIDPKAFHGRLVGTYGPDLENRETTSALATAAHATAGVNAGFFVLDPAAGAPGDPAGVGVYSGWLLSEPVAGRPALVLGATTGRATVDRFTWRGSVVTHGGRLPLDGVDRVPGLIRNCGGTADDQPTARPLHDVTCTDPDEIVRFTPEYGARTPSGPGVEAVLDAHGTVVSVRSPRGGALPASGGSVQATGASADRLRALARPGTRLRFTDALTTPSGTVHPNRSTYVLNGGPELVRAGRTHVTPARDGMVHPDDPSWYYGWAHKRNPRTLAGVDARGRTVLATADGRSTDSLGLSITETAQLARALGLRSAVNLDGGGSTTMVVNGKVINRPSDKTGERPVGDAVLVLP